MLLHTSDRFLYTVLNNDTFQSRSFHPLRINVSSFNSKCSC
nr:MAG TPA: hypothetical protein [Caudoviricetes sp.]